MHLQVWHNIDVRRWEAHLEMAKSLHNEGFHGRQLSFINDCGGINPYTLTAKLGLAWIDGSGPSERRRAAQPTCWSPAQGVKADLAIKQDPGRLE